MSSQVSIHFADREARQFGVEDGQTVLDAAKAAGYPLVSQCQVGTCGTCVATLHGGRAEMPNDRPLSLSETEIALGDRLLCQSTIHTPNAQFEVHYPSSLLSANPTVQFRGKITAIRWIASTVVELEFKLPKGFRFGFTPGQYCRIQVPDTDEWRSYSMASAENERGKLTFLVRILPDGAMSNFLRDRAKPGMVLNLEGPQGGFVLTPEARPTILMAGGTGLAPMLSIMSRLRYVRPAAPKLLLLFGCVDADQMFHLKELEDRQAYLPTLEVRAVLDDNSGMPELPQGNPVSALLESDLTPDSVAYLCGPPGMLHAAEEKLMALGMAHADIRAEQFLDSSN